MVAIYCYCLVQKVDLFAEIIFDKGILFNLAETRGCIPGILVLVSIDAEIVLQHF